MKAAILALGSRGDVEPYANLGQGLQEAGHEVRMITTQDFRRLVESKGIGFIELPARAQPVVQSSGASMRKLLLGFREVSLAFVQAAAEVVPVLAECDLILNQLPGGAFGADVAEKYGQKHWQVATIPLVPTGDFPMMGWPRGLKRLPGYSRATYAVSELLAWILLKGVVNLWRTKVLGLEARSVRELREEAKGTVAGVVLGVSRHVLPKPADWPDSVKISGYWHQSRDWEPSAELEDFLRAGSAPVFIGFGSMPLSDPRRTGELVLRAARSVGCRVVLSSGWGGLGQGRGQDDVFTVGDIAYEWLFPRMAAVVHHGGSGTTGAALAAGVPSLVVPFAFDQLFWGERVAALGAGPEAIRFRRLNSDVLARALERCLTQVELQRAASDLGVRIRAENGIQETVTLLEGHV